MNKLVTAVLCSLLLASCAVTGQTENDITVADVTKVEPWGQAQRVTRVRHVYLAGQPDRAGLAQARAAGVTTVINLREFGEAPLQQGVAESLGMAYYQIPVLKGSDSLDSEAVSAIEKIVQDQKGKPILLHCSSGNRASAWLAAHLALTHNKTTEDALAIAREAGLTNTGAQERARRYIEQQPGAQP